jgi:hypothetical protein
MMRNDPSPRIFPLAPLPAMAWQLLAGLGLATVVVALLVPWQQGTPGPEWLIAPFMAALVLVGPMLALRRRRVAIAGDTLVVAATFLTRRVAIDALALGDARIVDLRERTEMKPTWRTFGFALPGFQAGHYRLRDRRKAFCLLTDRSRVLVLPEHAPPGRDGRLLLLSPERPQVLLDALRAVAQS